MIGYASDLIVLSVSAALTAGFFIYDLKGMGGFFSQQCYGIRPIWESISASLRTLDPDHRAPSAHQVWI
jgi:hypothetical protein